MDIRILLVEDDEHICNTVKTFLREAGYKVDSCMDGNEAYKNFYDNIYQLVILDIMLPGMSGQVDCAGTCYIISYAFPHYHRRTCLCTADDETHQNLGG